MILWTQMGKEYFVGPFGRLVAWLKSLSTVALSCAYVDGTFLTGKYKGQILTAIGVDVENRVVPIAFAFIESENTDSWLWFLRHVKIGVVGDISNVCIIHGRHAGLLSAVHKCKQTRMSRVHGQTCIADGVCDTWGPTSINNSRASA